MMTRSKDTNYPIKLLAADMWAVFNFDDPNACYQKFLSRGRPPIKHFIEGVVLYPEVIIPTEDFLSLTVLVGVLGERAVIQLLEAGVLKFIRLRGSIAYVGNGAGVKAYEMGSPEKPAPHCAPLESAIVWALQGLTEKPKDPLLPKLVSDLTTEVSTRAIIDQIRHETYMDVLNSPGLRSVFALRNQDMDHLADINPNQVRIYGGPDSEWTSDEINIVLALATTNVELYLAETAGASDSSTVNPVGHLIKAKAERAFGAQTAKAFAELREISDVPEVGEAVLQKEVAIDELLKLVHSRNGQEFQKWFHDNCHTDMSGVSREYVRLLKEVPRIQSAPVKILRFIVTSALGKLPILGDITGAIDSFFLEKWLRGSSPKYFIEDLSQLVGKKQSAC